MGNVLCPALIDMDDKDPDASCKMIITIYFYVQAIISYIIDKKISLLSRHFHGNIIKEMSQRYSDVNFSFPYTNVTYNSLRFNKLYYNVQANR